MCILIIDGQGGNIGKQIVKCLLDQKPGIDLIVVGTNSVATAAMLKAGASEGATGENAVAVCCRKADIIIGPIGITVPNAMLGEVSPAMAAAVGESRAKRILIPIQHCDTYVVGLAKRPIAALVEEAVSLACNWIDTGKDIP